VNDERDVVYKALKLAVGYIRLSSVFSFKSEDFIKLAKKVKEVEQK
jgi:hypothetical protein